MTSPIESTAPDCRAPLQQPSRPAAALLAGSWDCHCHVFGPPARFPYAPARRYTPPAASAEDLYALHAHLGVTHAVLVQAACHGTDHSALLDAIAGSDGRYRGVALLPEHADAAEVRRLHEGGIRGARLNFVAHLGAPPEPARLHEVAALIAPYGWHLCLHIDGEALPRWLPELRRLPVPFVIDHMARLDATAGMAQPAMQALLALADCPQAWVKVSAVDRISAGRAPFRDGVAYVRALLEALPERVLWGTDWPHPNIQGDMPDDGQLVDLFFLACPDPALRRRVLVENPLRLYGA